MQLSTLIGRDLKDDISVQALVDDSRLVSPGDIFVFDARIHKDVSRFINDAKAKEAAAVVSNVEEEGVIFHPFPGQVLAKWARQQFATQPENLVAVTGTNGKTSVAWFYSRLMQSVKAASIGTLGVYKGDEKLSETGYTSPTALKLHEILSELAADQVTHACVEASSHALSLNRLDGATFKAAAFTNISQDHLDFHGTMDDYLVAKARLFSEVLPEGGTAVLPIARPESWPMAAMCKERGINIITYGSANAALVVDVIDARADGMALHIKYEDVEFTTQLPLVGAFQAENVAAALGLALATGLKKEDMASTLQNLTCVPGRMEVIDAAPDQPAVVVDYAHTPDALERALSFLKPLTKGKLIVVFGCGGDRDRTKRPQMGEIAARLADKVIVSDDNPRGEDAAVIRQEILAACTNGEDIGDRAAAIEAAISKACADDVILLAGKGHETGQIIKDEVLPFDDRDVARNILKEVKAA